MLVPGARAGPAERYTLDCLTLLACAMSNSSSFFSPSDVVRAALAAVAGHRPLLVKVGLALGGLSVLVAALGLMAGAPGARIVALQLALLLLPLLHWWWYGSQAARLGLTALCAGQAAIAAYGLVSGLTISREPMPAWAGAAGVALGVAFCGALWHPTTSAWLRAAAGRRSDLSLEARRSVAQYDLRWSFIWMAAPLFAMKLTRRTPVPMEALLTLCAPAVLAGVAVLVINFVALRTTLSSESP